MCFYLKSKHTKEKTAKRNIKCFKALTHDLRAPIYYYQYELGKLHDDGVELKVIKYNYVYNKTYYKINEGFHSFSTMKRANNFKDSGQKIFHAVIPKGAKYYYNKEEDEEYVSNQIIIKKEIEI